MEVKICHSNKRSYKLRIMHLKNLLWIVCYGPQLKSRSRIVKESSTLVVHS